jgi:hypothetical protein
VFIGVWAVEVVKGVLMGAPAFAADDEVFMTAASVNGVAEM